MQIDLLLTTEMQLQLPENIQIIANFGIVEVMFPESRYIEVGTHCIIEGEQEDIQEYFHKFEYMIIGNGFPMSQEFTMKSY